MTKLSDRSEIEVDELTRAKWSQILRKLGMRLRNGPDAKMMPVIDIPRSVTFKLHFKVKVQK